LQGALAGRLSKEKRTKGKERALNRKFDFWALVCVGVGADPDGPRPGGGGGRGDVTSGRRYMGKAAPRPQKDDKKRRKKKVSARADYPELPKTFKQRVF